MLAKTVNKKRQELHFQQHTEVVLLKLKVFLQVLIDITAR